MQLLIAEYDYQGYGWFWAINERIGESDECRLDISKRRNLAALANDLKTSPDELEEFVDFLASSDVELIHKEGGFIWTDQTQEDLDRAMKAREAAKNRRVGRQYTDESKTSGDEHETSYDEMHGRKEGQEGLEGGEEDAPARGASSSPQFLPWLLTFLRTEREMRNPEQFARKVARNPGKYPDLLAEFELSRSPDAKSRASPKQCCPHCGKQTLFVTDSAGVTRCPVCNKLIGEFEDDVPFTAEG